MSEEDSDLEEIRGLAKEELSPGLLEHVEKVVEKAEWLLESYPEADEEVVKSACWLHDIVHQSMGYSGEEHNLESAEKAGKIMKELEMDQDKIDKVIECIESNRTTTPQEPTTIEARIVASADNLSHFDSYETLVQIKSEEWARNKLERDLDSDFMLPEAREHAEDKLEEIKN